MSGPPRGEDDATIRRPARGAVQPGRPPAGGGWGRRLVLGGAVGAVAVAAGGAALLLWPEGPPPPQRLGPRRLLPPLLRASVRGEDTIFALVRRTEQDAADEPGRPAPRERVELLALAPADLAPRFAVHLATVGRGTLSGADGLIAEQGATIWIWLGGLGAVSAVDGQVLADQAGIAGRNPSVAGLERAGRGQLRLGDALVFEAGGGQAWRLDPRDFSASPAVTSSPRPLPALSPAAPHGQGGPTAFRVLEARMGEAWVGLPGEDVKLAAPVAARGPGTRFLSPAAPPPGTRQQMWRGVVRMASAAPPNWPANFPDRFGQAERLMDLSTVPAVAGLSLAGFLTAGTEAPIVLADPAGLLVLHGAPGQALELLRVAPDGRVAWRAALPMTRLRSVLPGPRHLVLAGWAEASRDAAEAMVSVALGDGAVATGGFGA